MTFRLMLGLTLMMATNIKAQGTLMNGFTYQAVIAPESDVDVWTFSANAGDAIIVRAGEITQTNALTVRLTLLNPSGDQVATSAGSFATEIAVTATNSGTFTLNVSDEGANGTGQYRLTLAKTGEAVVTAAGDEGGALTNGVQNVCGLPTGDLDVWTFTANIGDSIVVRAGETNAGSLLTPWVRMYSPTGVLLDSNSGSSAGEVTFRATNSGAFMVVMADANDAGSESLAYRLTLAKTGEAVVTAAGDDGGTLTNGVQNVCGLPTGDLDVWTFTACAGDWIDLQITELTGGTGFTPSMRLYAPNGVLTNSESGSTTAQISRTVPLTGTCILIVGNNAEGAGTYQLTGTGISTGLILCQPLISGTDLVIRSAGGPASSNYVLLATTNIALSLNEWTPIHTNQFSAFGEFSVTNLFSPTVSQEFFRVRMP
jgi:hypothetical protein